LKPKRLAKEEAKKPTLKQTKPSLPEKRSVTKSQRDSNSPKVVESSRATRAKVVTCKRSANKAVFVINKRQKDSDDSFSSEGEDLEEEEAISKKSSVAKSSMGKASVKNTQMMVSEKRKTRGYNPKYAEELLPQLALKSAPMKRGRKPGQKNGMSKNSKIVKALAMKKELEQASDEEEIIPSESEQEEEVVAIEEEDLQASEEPVQNIAQIAQIS
jgi:hypothetical protein